MTICVIGGGNLGTLIAAECAAKGHEVVLAVSDPEHWNGELSVWDAQETCLLRARVASVTNRPEQAVQGADMVFITYPASMFRALAQQLLGTVQPGQWLVVVPGSGGAQEAFEPLTDAGAVLLGMQRVHCIARVRKRGDSVYALGRKPLLKAGAVPSDQAERGSHLLEALFDIPCQPLPNYLSVTLSPSNPILHTSRLYAMFRDWKPGVVYPRCPLFYEDWDDEASELLFRCDDELQKLCATIPDDLSSVQSLKEYYESPTVPAMTNKIRSIPAFRDILSPMKRVEGGWEPDFSSRYFSADFPFGLKILTDLASKWNVAAPTMNEIWNWYLRCTEQLQAAQGEEKKR